MALANKVIYQNGAIKKFEKPEVCEAIKVANANRWTVALSPTEWDQREARLKDEYGKNHVKRGEPIPGSPALEESASQFNDALLDEQAKKIDEQNHEITRLLSLVEKKENSISRLYYEKSVLEKENEDLKKGELPARYFDKALVDEQSEKIKKLEHEKLDILEMASSCKQTIEELIKEKSNLEDQITVLNACKKHNDKIDRKQIKCLGKEVARLNGIIHDKNAILSDVAEELRLTKIREKNLVEVSQKYVKENEKLKKELADKVVDKIDAQALKSAESALAYKEKVIADLGKELKRLNALVNHISGKYDGAKINLKVRTEGLERLKNELEEKTKLIEIVRNASREYCDYGVAANEFIKELAHLYVLVSNNGIINVEMLERCKNYQAYGFPANCNRETKKEIDDIARGNKNKKPRIPTPEEPKHDNSFEDFINKTIDNYNRRAANLGCVGSKDGNGISDQMVGVDIAEEGKDHSGVIVLCGKDFVKKYKENKEFVHDFFKRHKETAEELYEVADDACEQLLLFGEIIIKSEE